MKTAYLIVGVVCVILGLLAIFEGTHLLLGIITFLVGLGNIVLADIK